MPSGGESHGRRGAQGHQGRRLEIGKERVAKVLAGEQWILRGQIVSHGETAGGGEMLRPIRPHRHETRVEIARGVGSERVREEHAEQDDRHQRGHANSDAVAAPIR